MKRTVVIGLCLLLLVGVVLAVAEQANGRAFDDLPSQAREKASEALQEHLRAGRGGRVIVEYSDAPGRRYGAFEGSPGAIMGLLRRADVARVEPDQEVAVLADTVPWGVSAVGAPFAWPTATGVGVRVAVVDSGVAHPDLAPFGGWNVLTNSSNYSDSYGHGTMVSGVLAALLNDQDVVGVAPGVELLVVKAFDGPTTYLSDVLAGVSWALNHDAQIVVMSFGFPEYSVIFHDFLAGADGVLFVGASGNDGGGVLYPAAYDSVVAVGAVDNTSTRASFSNYGPSLELVAPGVDVLTTGLNGLGAVDGTSVAAPHVAGVAALLWENNPGLTSAEVRALLQHSALDLGVVGRDNEYGYGLVQADLSINDTTLGNASYYYEVFNVTDYGTPEQEETFWLSGFGTIDDVAFAEGVYKVFRSTPDGRERRYLSVAEDLSVSLLGVDMDWYDDWSVEGSDDGMVWLYGEVTDFYFFDDASDFDAYCIDYELPLTYDKCWAKSSTALSDCEDAFPSTIGYYCDNGRDCVTTGFDSYHSLPTGSFTTPERRELTALTFYDCAGSYPAYSVYDNNYYYCFDMKGTDCTSSTSFEIEGRYTMSGNWHVIETHSCSGSKQCDPAAESTTSTETLSMDDPSDDAYPCKSVSGGSCTTDDDCYTGLTCSGGTCTSGGGTVDLAIVDIIPIQVIPDVDMVQGKSGYVVVNVTNYGNTSAHAYVRAWFNGGELEFAGNIFPDYVNYNNGSVYANQSRLFIFKFTPDVAGTNLIVNASVEVGD